MHRTIFRISIGGIQGVHHFYLLKARRSDSETCQSVIGGMFSCLLYPHGVRSVDREGIGLVVSFGAGEVCLF